MKTVLTEALTCWRRSVCDCLREEEQPAATTTEILFTFPPVALYCTSAAACSCGYQLVKSCFKMLNHSENRAVIGPVCTTSGQIQLQG